MPVTRRGCYTSKADMSAYFLPPPAAAQYSATYFLHCFDIPPNGTPSQRRFFVVRKLSVGNAHKRPLQ